MNKNKLPDFPAIALFLGMVVLALVMVLLPSDGGGFVREQREGRGPVARVRLQLNGFEIDEIKENPRGTEFTGNRAEITAGGNVLSLDNVTLKGRGNSTWGQPKAPLSLKAKDKIELLGAEKSRKWVLLANYLDSSNLRNALGLYAAELIEMSFPIKGDFVELYVGDDYRGLYYLTEKVEIGKGRVDLRDPFGVLVERRSGARDIGDVCYEAKRERCFILSDAVSEDNAEAAMEVFAERFSLFETALDGGDYDAIKHYIDTDSFAKYYLVSELSVNPDAYITSEYFYLDGEDDLIHMGPAWDYDYAFGNKGWIWTDDESYHSPTELNKNVPEGSFIEKLLLLPEFQAEVKDVYKRTLKKQKQELLNFAVNEAWRIDLLAHVNNVRWGLLDYHEESYKLVMWLKTRLEYLDGVFSEVVE